jgi:hypothetical protein|eukprot:COSAG02_NODE_44932_length_361_cov_1.572519_1_plen_77_part_00
MWAGLQLVAVHFVAVRPRTMSVASVQVGHTALAAERRSLQFAHASGLFDAWWLVKAPCIELLEESHTAREKEPTNQ